MGGGEKPKEGAGKDGDPSTCPALVMEAVAEYMKVPATRTEMTVMAKLRARLQPDEDRRAPISICAAIDRSGSMKEHLPLVKETLQFMMQQLRAEDMLCLITFDHDVRVQLPLTRMDSAGKLEAERAIDAMKERGHTNLSGGLLAALEALYRVPANKACLVESVLLFTDGKANVGIKDQGALVKATKSLLRQIGRQACVFTFGFGAEHDADLLHAVADAGNGLFYYIDNSDSIPESFCDCLGGLLSVAAQNVRLTIKACDNVTITKPQTTYHTVIKEPNKCYEVTIPDIYCEEERCILAKLTAPLAPEIQEATTVALFTCSVEYFDVLCSKPNTGQVEGEIVRNNTLPKPVPSDYVDEIELHKMRVEVAESLSRANSMAGAGNIPAARQLLNDATVRIQGSRVAFRPLAVHLLQTVQESLGGLQDTVTYKEHGKATLTNYAGSHWQQRSNLAPSLDSYQREKRKKSKPPSRGVTSEPPMAATLSPSPMITVSPYRITSKRAMLSKHSSSSPTKKDCSPRLTMSFLQLLCMYCNYN